MLLQTAYRGHSVVRQSPAGLAVALAPNLRRDRVSYVGALRHPLRFREAISALHDVVISDLRFKPKDKKGYEEWKKQEAEFERRIRTEAVKLKRSQLEAEKNKPMPKGLEQRFERCRKKYWDARNKYGSMLLREDPELWRMLMPCDPVITVSPDVLFFECFSADESTYGCLNVQRDAFQHETDVSLGTTNVDYSWRLYEHFQTIRSYRETRFTIDPLGFEVKTNAEDDGNYREEKIDLPQSWLRGFATLQSAMSLPMKRVPVSREGLYSLVAFLKRHKAKASPRAVRFELEPGQPVRIVLEPWNKEIALHDTPYPGPKKETIRVWGRDRLRVLGRLLPVLDRVDVFLLGTGLPVFWVCRMGEMQLTLGLSGWTTNDWTSGGSALDQLAPPVEPSEGVMRDIAAAFRSDPTWKLSALAARTKADTATVSAGLNKLALLGQVIHDLPHGVYRWRQVMPVTLSAEVIGPENEETVAARQFSGWKVRVTSERTDANGQRHVAGIVDGRSSAELTLDGDDRIVGGKCGCSYFYTGGLRKGPCRHLQALRNKVLGVGQDAVNLESWFKRFTN
ncbi:zinc finger swim domain protein : Uncharacterized protein OS=Singulisphaera acidiphila (strain ATCC BAA-1392 / DSM 18658 / VKM B-2454 / MOB10) GN=Sinac_4397 PE=4 SV=1 [Gemmataceae bacterium]|nr:zinc finger swim domain protein : Uncharacterized protein OS=Singulisphaera acidiphila (strain ATCC BAA-1392 / DSM 18658 / VKM B-2454 / MOB10) GN=Sinac_4397 PE=4 SV=1 [Gemmataceae bacterium]VTT99844.1 zinc finger swim domain protein : Uncharacterized protein OS=Singulisphaera acidiphila (strain ATCC BAA-1392 / DSM 18658 / VKM B-2454 / MOB10) GN=Sinac_4397 PE=4 SV=1 [Gemmataceae bacterium]